jgi:hypothetical protein
VAKSVSREIESAYVHTNKAIGNAAIALDNSEAGRPYPLVLLRWGLAEYHFKRAINSYENAVCLEGSTPACTGFSRDILELHRSVGDLRNGVGKQGWAVAAYKQAGLEEEAIRKLLRPTRKIVGVLHYFEKGRY